MGESARFFLRPTAGERVHTTVTLTGEESCGLFGTVLRAGAAVPDAAVLLFDAESRALTASSVTDSEGQFAFASLEAGRLYLAKVYADGVQIRELEITV